VYTPGAGIWRAAVAPYLGKPLIDRNERHCGAIGDIRQALGGEGPSVVPSPQRLYQPMAEMLDSVRHRIRHAVRLRDGDRRLTSTVG
jgi:hypothetical protein